MATERRKDEQMQGIAISVPVRAAKLQWDAAMKAKGHTPALNDEGEFNSFAYSAGTHNGPACSECGRDCCWHCTEIDDIPECTW
jgi:hypothetical protein